MLVRRPISIIKGGKGDKGDKGDVGPAGPNTVPTAAAMATVQADAGSAFSVGQRAIVNSRCVMHFIFVAGQSLAKGTNSDTNPLIDTSDPRTGGEAILKVALFASTRRSAHAFERQLADRRPPSVVGLYLSSVAEISGQARPADESHKLQAESLRWLL